MTKLDPDEPEAHRPSGGMRSAMSGLSQSNISGPGMSGYLDLRPDTGIPGLAWLGIAAGLVALVVFLWSWLFGL